MRPSPPAPALSASPDVYKRQLVDRNGISFFAVGIGVGLCALLCARVELMERGSLCRGQRGVECLILGLVEGAVEVVGLAPVVTGGGDVYKRQILDSSLIRFDLLWRRPAVSAMTMS